MTDDLSRRVAILGALADPTRLRIVDLLTIGDLSSSEIVARLALTSNLVAHHLQVLESAHIVERSRSEFDRRRVYIGLRPEVFDLLAPETLAAPSRVLFVCTANSARSQLAEVIWREVSDVPVASAGTRPADAVNPAALAAAARHGLAIDADVQPVHIDAARRADDFVVTVCDDAHERLAGHDDLHWSIADPAAIGSAQAFDAAFERIDQRVRALSRRIASAA